MQKRLCIFKTHNHAITAFGLLKKAGIKCEIVQTPSAYVMEKSCSYSVSFAAESEKGARAVLKKNNLDFYIV